MKKISFTVMMLLAFVMLYPRFGMAVNESKPCNPEPTNMPISYGDVIACSIAPNAADIDTFRFVGSAGEKIVILVTNPGAHLINPSIELFGPNGVPIAMVSGFFSARIADPSFMLTVSGTHTIVVSDNQSNNTGPYTLTLERVDPPSPAAQPIQYDQVKTDEINPIGDMDVVVFNASINDNIRILITNPGAHLINPCIELFAPDGTRTGSQCGFFSANIDSLLSQPGTHAILVSDSDSNNAGPYGLSLTCITGPCLAPPVCDGRPATITGTPEDNVIMGTAGDDVIVALGGNDIIHGLGGNDRICGGDGNDVILAGSGNDRVFGDAGSNILFGGPGNDVVFGGTQNDLLFGEAGADTLNAGSGNDSLDGGTGIDTLNGDAGNDTLNAGPDNDRLNGGTGSDICDGSTGTDVNLGGCEVTLNIP